MLQQAAGGGAGAGAGAAAEELRPCFFCSKHASKYSCPRCSEFYCSVDCYKSEKHQNCSESFYRDCINEEMSSYEPDDESKKKMMDILTKMHKNEELDDPEEILQYLNRENEMDEEPLDSDDEEFVELQERIANVNLDDPEAVWDALTEDERNEFEALVSGGDVTKLVPMWEPWWNYSKETKLVEEVAKDSKEEEALKRCPRIKDVPELTALSKALPADCVKYNIVNLLAGYAVTTRYFNNEYESGEFVGCLLSVCASLGKSSNFNDIETAVAAVAHECLDSMLIDTDKQSIEVMKQDVHHILKGPSKENRLHYCNSALSELYKVFSEVKNKLKHEQSSKVRTDKEFSKKFPQHQSEHLPVLELSKVKNYVKKIEYYLSYIRSYGLPSVG